MTRRALLIGCAGASLARSSILAGTGNDIARVSHALERYGFTLDICTDHDATRQGILDRMAHLIACTQADDAVVVYYSGHGGRVRNTGVFPGLETSHTRTYHRFLVPNDFSFDREFRGILERELGHMLARLTSRTRNVSVVLDCCYSAGMMRGEGLRSKALPDRDLKPWERRYNQEIQLLCQGLEVERCREGGPELHPESNPLVVRLEASVSNRKAYELPTGSGPVCGVLTEAWVGAIERHRGQRVTWEGIFGYIRERVRQRSREQEPGLAGPRSRLLFQLDQAPAPGAIGLVRAGSSFYLQGGTLVGVQPGDHFVIMAASATRADPHGALARALAIEVGPDRARVQIEHADEQTGQPLDPQRDGDDVLDGARAFLVHREAPWEGVILQCSDAMRADLSARIEVTSTLTVCYPDEDALAVVEELPGSAGAPLLEIRDPQGKVVPARVTVDEVLRALQRLQRADLVRSFRSGTEAHALELGCDLLWGRASDGIVRPADETGGVVEVGEGEEILFEIANREKPRPKQIEKTTLYGTILDIDVDGMVARLTNSQPLGIVVKPGEDHHLGYRSPGRRGKLRLDWPPGAPRTSPGLRSLVLVAANMPHDLGALETHGLEPCGMPRAPMLLDFVEPPRTATRGSPDREPISTMRYAIRRIDFLVVPGPAPA